MIAGIRVVMIRNLWSQNASGIVTQAEPVRYGSSGIRLQVAGITGQDSRLHPAPSWAIGTIPAVFHSC